MANDYTSRRYLSHVDTVAGSGNADDRDARSGVKKRKLKTLDKYVIFSITVLLAYTAVEFYFSTMTEIQHDTLTTCLYATFGGEILSCCLIKIFKLREEQDHV